MNPIMEQSRDEIPVIQRVIAVLWPSFLTSGVATGLFFTAFDPIDLMMISGQAEISRMGVYSIGFFLFWLLTASHLRADLLFPEALRTDQRSSLARGISRHQAGDT